jgi:hypothetical protein
VPEEFVALCKSCWEQNPDARCNFDGVIKQLEEIRKKQLSVVPVIPERVPIQWQDGDSEPEPGFCGFDNY